MATRPSTRSGANPSSNDSEVEEIKRQLLEKQKLLQEQEEILRKQAAEWAKTREEAWNEIKTRKRELEASSVGHQDQEELQGTLLREMRTLREDMNTLHGPSRAATMRISDTSLLDTSTQETARISPRDAVECIPHFNGYNIPLSQFIRSCRRAKELVPLPCEKDLTKLIINKLRDRAYLAVEDEPCNNIMQLIDILSTAFGSAKTVDQYKGEMSTTYLRGGEHILDFIGRIKELRSSILDIERRQRGHITTVQLNEIDCLTARSFCEGLPLEFRLQMGPELKLNPFNAFAAAKIIARRMEIDIQRRQKESYPGNRRTEASSPKYKLPEPSRPPAREIKGPTPWQEQRTIPPGNPPSWRDNKSQPNTTDKVCRYCKALGHTIEECRKRQYSNSRQENEHPYSIMTDANRAGPSKPLRPITVTVDNEPEDEPSITETTPSQS